MARKSNNPRIIKDTATELLRAERLALPNPCESRLSHASHSQEIIVAKWLGGGVATTNCPGI